MKRIIVIVAAMALMTVGADQARAGSIAGPSSFSVVGGSDTMWGIEFLALQNSTLTGFDYHHHPDTFGQPFTGTVSVYDETTNTTVYSSAYGTGTPTVISYSGLNVALQSGHLYGLIATSSIVSGGNDEVSQVLSPYSSDPAYPVSNADISVTGGIFSTGGAFQKSNYWAAFTNITTNSGAVPEPASISMLGVGIASLAFYARKRWNSIAA
jgi:hypothetical protein